jgi:uncharacterized membrane-anchored protein YhcB (DUF1043 family)
MWIYLLLGLFIGIPIGTLSEKFFIPFLDVKHEKFVYKEIVECTEYQLEANALVKEFEDKYGEKQELSPAIGFQYYPEQSEFDDEEDKLKNKIGF